MPTVDAPTAVLDATRRGTLHDLIAHVDDLRAELKRLLDDPSPLQAQDARDRFESLSAMVDVQDRVGWPGND